MNKDVIMLPVTMVQVHNFTVWLAPIGCAKRPAPWGGAGFGGCCNRVVPSHTLCLGKAENAQVLHHAPDG